MDNIIEKNKITNNRFITSKSYNNLEEKDIKKEKRKKQKELGNLVLKIKIILQWIMLIIKKKRKNL